LFGRISAVGTNHRPVSPKKVVVAGRVSTGVLADDDWAEFEEL
jgi:hypothetical protein